MIQVVLSDRGIIELFHFISSDLVAVVRNTIFFKFFKSDLAFYLRIEKLFQLIFLGLVSIQKRFNLFHSTWLLRSKKNCFIYQTWMLGILKID